MLVLRGGGETIGNTYGHKSVASLRHAHLYLVELWNQGDLLKIHEKLSNVVLFCA